MDSMCWNRCPREPRPGQGSVKRTGLGPTAKKPIIISVFLYFRNNLRRKDTYRSISHIFFLILFREIVKISYLYFFFYEWRIRKVHQVSIQLNFRFMKKIYLFFFVIELLFCWLISNKLILKISFGLLRLSIS